MSTWNKISLFKFQQIDTVIGRADLPDLDKAWFSACIVFDMTEYQFNELKLKKATKLTKKVSDIFSSKPEFVPSKRIGKYVINYDPGTLSFGQYIELAFFLSNPPVQMAHLILASISRSVLGKYKTEYHRRKSEYYLTAPVSKVIGSLNFFTKRFEAFNREYKSLFGVDTETSGDVQGDTFNKRYGWIYSASQVAEYQRIPLDEAFGLPVRQAFNALGYLKAKGRYEADQLKKK